MLVNIFKVRLHNLTFYARAYSAARPKAILSSEVLDKCVSKLLFNSVIDRAKLQRKVPDKAPLATQLNKEGASLKTELENNPLPISLRFLSDDIEFRENQILGRKIKPEEDKCDETIAQFPFGGHNVAVQETAQSEENPKGKREKDPALQASEEIRKRVELQKDLKNWMTAYDNYDDCQEIEENDEIDWKINYGTCDPKSAISKVPCGGCGALLHCKDTAIPGYIPSEIFKNSTAKGSSNLEAITCQRCHFLKHYNIALQSRVAPEDYPKILTSISKRDGVVLLLVDLLDFPCSIYPGIGEIFGHKTPIVLVGNKVDLLPKDNRNYLKHIKRTLLNYVKLSGFATFNIKHVALISAKTGYGVEDLITNLGTLYEKNGDVYIVGSTNVGKSSLFNALLQSDYCKDQAADLIQRATTSIWPGTTLNLLKFPIKRPAGYRQYLRHQRLKEAEKTGETENWLRVEQLRVTKNPKFATLIGHIDVTRDPRLKERDETKDNFSVQGTANAAGRLKMGIDTKRMEFAYSKWCYDTPGVVQSDQITDLLTTEELVLTLPKMLIIPRTYCLKPGSTLFIAGLSRLDFTKGPGSVRLTVFASGELPITVCRLDEAEEIYQGLLGSNLFKVPMGGRTRLEKWPGLEMGLQFEITGEHWRQSAQDVVLSSSGWIALTGRATQKYQFQAWTPGKRGIHLRDCLLPNAVALTGDRLKHSVAYKRHKFYLK